jgi:hypothetical protein
MQKIQPISTTRKKVSKYYPGIFSKTPPNQNSQERSSTQVKRGRLVFYRFLVRPPNLLINNYQNLIWGWLVGELFSPRTVEAI